MKLKKGMALLLSLMVVLMVAGCAPSSSKADGKGEKVSGNGEITLTYWHAYGDREEEEFKNVVLPMWNELHPEIKIEAVRQDSGQLHQMLVTSFGTGTSPDVGRVDIIYLPAYAAQGGLTALSDYPDFTELSENFLEAPLSTNRYDGKYYGFPLDTNCKAAVMNTNVLKEIGLDEIPDTMEEFIEAAKKRGSYSINVNGLADWELCPLFWLFGGALTNEDCTVATGYLDSDESVVAMTKMKELHDEQILTIRDVDGSLDGWDGINSEYAMIMDGPWFFPCNEGAQERGLAPATIPTYQGQTASIIGGEDIAVFASSKHQEAAYEFAKFMVSEEVQRAMLDAGQFPILKSLIEEKMASEKDPTIAIYMEQLKSARSRITSPNSSAIQEIWTDMTTRIFTEDADIATAMHEAAVKIDEQLK